MTTTLRIEIIVFSPILKKKEGLLIIRDRIYTGPIPRLAYLRLCDCKCVQSRKKTLRRNLNKLRLRT